MKSIRLLLIPALLLASSAFAQTRSTQCDPATPNNAICFWWTAVTLDLDNKPLPAPAVYRVQQRTGTAGAWSDVATSTGVLQYYAKNLAPGEYFFRVYANCAGCTQEGSSSNTASKTATPNPVIPQAPVIIIAATIRAGKPPIYRVVYTVKPKADEVVFVAPESMRPLFANR